MRIGDTYPYTLESGEHITYQVCTAEELHAFLENARSRAAIVGAFDDPFRRIVGWYVGDVGKALTLMEIKEKRASGAIDPEFWECVRTLEGRREIAARYSVRNG